MTRAVPFFLRMAGYLAFWVVLAGAAPKDLLAGVLTAALAAWLSLTLLPPGELVLRPVKALGLFLRVLGQSVVAGLTVARIALSPAMPLSPGMVDYPARIPPGNRRFAFMSFLSLLPGTLPVQTGDGDGIAVHALDLRQPVAQQLAAEEARFSAAFATVGAP